MKILVTTPTGRIGRLVVRELLAPEFSVRVIVRDPARLPEEVRAQVEVIQGSMEDAATLQDALVGVEAVFFCVPSMAPQETEVRGHYERFARVMARAIREARTRRVVTISAAGAGRARNAGPISGLQAMEDILNESSAAIRHLRCGVFLENFLGQAQDIAEHGVIASPVPGHIALPFVATKDIADVALRWLVRRDWSGVAGAAVQGTEPISFNQAAAVIERVLVRPVRHQKLAAKAYVQLLVSRGASEEFAQSQVAMFAELALDITSAESRVGDMATTALSEWVREELIPVVGGGPAHGNAVSCGCEV